MTRIDPEEATAGLHASRLEALELIKALPANPGWTDDELRAIETAAHDLHDTALMLKGMARICMSNRVPGKLKR